MIKRNRAWIAALLLMALPACNDDEWLTETPEDFIQPETFFRNEADAVAALNSVYDTFIQFDPVCGADDYYGRNLIMLAEYPTAEVTSRYGATHERGGIDALNIPGSTHPYLASTWLCAYSGIAHANLVIANVPKISDANIRPMMRTRIEAEARFVRAVHYFTLARLFGGVPLRLEPVTTLQNLQIPRNSAKEVYDAIIADLNFAAQNLPATYPAATDVGRATSGAANALLAKVHLQYGAVHGGGAASFNASANAARQVRGYQLLPDFSRIFLCASNGSVGVTCALGNERNAEIIFAVQNTRVSGLGGRIGQHFAPIGGGLSGAHNGGISFYPEWPFYRDWPATDRRKAATFLTTYRHPTRGVLTWTRPGMTSTQLNNFGTSGGGPVFTKYLDPEAATGSGDENDWILLRYADVLLMLAEAINLASGPTAEAYAAVNQVRNRAGLPNLTPGLSQQQFHNAIHLERRYELVMEGHGYFDYQRNWDWGKTRIEANMLAGLPVSQGGQGLNASPYNNSVAKAGVAGAVVEEKYRFFPIPEQVRATNPLLEQNPGW